jgi:hypothetical protein
MNFPLATPSLEEQKQIMEELARTLTAFERARNAITSQIQTLQTLRSTLIAHAVTGKIHITAVPGMCSSIKATANHPESSRV